MKKIIITCSLPYANGNIHLGHILEHIQADILVRYNRINNNLVWFISGDDVHGTPMMLKINNNKNINKLIKKTRKRHILDFNKFDIFHDNYYTTNSNENYNFTIFVYNKLLKRGYIKYKFISQFFDKNNKIFLSDRYVIGTCPKCFSKNQYGDYCENCGITYNQTKLINPISIISKKKPVIKYTKEIFFNVYKFKNYLINIINSNIISKEISNKIKDLLNNNLKMWNISRNKPYYGFKIFKNKFFYVWFDALIGYISIFKNLCIKKNINFNKYWNKKTKTKLYHFIGKDVINFHILFWPSILKGISYRIPNRIFIHGHVTYKKNKLSKSNKTIEINKWLKFFDSDSLRYYYASKLSYKIKDINLNLLDFMNKINNDLINKIINLFSRSTKFLNKYFNNKLSNKIFNNKLYKLFIYNSFKIKNLFKKINFKEIIKKTIYFSNIINKFININKPWKILKKNKNHKLHQVSSMIINLFKILITWIKPIIPNLTNKIEYFLNIKLNWLNLNKPLLNHKIKNYKMLYKKINIKQINLFIKSII